MLWLLPLMGTAPAEGQGGGGGISFLFPMLMVFAIIYFLMIMPQRRAQKTRAAMLARVPDYRPSKFQLALPAWAAAEMVGSYLLDLEGAARFLAGLRATAPSAASARRG